MLRLIRQKSFKKSLKKYRYNKQVLESLIYIVDLLVHEKPIPSKYKDHALTGKLKGVRELHLKPDDLLLYLKIDHESITLIDIGSHANVLGK